MMALRKIENPVVKVDFAPKEGKMSKVSKIVLSHDEEIASRLIGKKFFEFRIDAKANAVYITDEDGQSQRLKLNQPMVLRNKTGEYKLRLCEDINDVKKRAFHQFVIWSVVLHMFFAVTYVISPNFSKTVKKKDKVVDSTRIQKIIEKIKAKKLKKVEPPKPEIVAKPKPKPKPIKKVVAKPKPKPRKKVVAKPKPKKKIVAKIKPKPKKKVVLKKKTPPKKFVAKKNTKNKKIDLAKKQKARLLAQQRAKQQANQRKAAAQARAKARVQAKKVAQVRAKAAAVANARAQKIAKIKAIANAKAALQAKKLAGIRAKAVAAAKAKANAQAKAVAIARAKAKAAAEIKARAVAVARAKAKAAAEAKARAVTAKKAKLAKSLNFLSSGPGKFQLANQKYDANAKNYRETASLGGGKDSALTAGGAGKKGNYLASIANSRGKPSGPIETTGSRALGTGSMYGEAGSGGGGGKALNGVQGKVTLAALHADGPGGGGTDMSGAFGDGAGGIEVSGMGSVDQSALEKALARRLDKFQYCYEKALLSDASLSGNIMMGWKINTSGKAWSIEVVKSQMNNSKLHGCISKEIRGIPFPRPKGGNLYVKFPFNFSSSTL